MNLGRSTRVGITLVEVLVVLAVIGLLISLLLPAIQSARESSRRKACSNQLRQLTLAMLQHEMIQQHFPTGGWGWEYVGDPDNGFGPKQPGGWLYNVLPFFEQGDLHALGRGLGTHEKRIAAARLIATRVPGLICPSRREDRLFPHHGLPYNGEIVNAAPYSFSSRVDYAINVGVVHDLECEELRDQQEDPDEEGESDDDPIIVEIRCDTSKFDGVSFYFSQVAAKHIIDGLSHTYALGEKYLDANEYESGIDAGDNESAYTGVNADQFRTTSAEYPLIADHAGSGNKYAFGSSHGDGFHMAFCDGAVRFVAFDVHPRIHERRGTRDGGEAVEIE